jgi:hypothetical protein
VSICKRLPFLPGLTGKESTLFQLPPAVQMSIYQKPTARVLKNKHQAASQGVRRFGKRSIFIDM